MRRKNQKLTLFYKMAHNLTPDYLTSLIPSTVTETSSYNLRNSNDIRTVRARTSQYFSSFLPSTIRELNNLPEEQRNSLTIASFKYQLNQPNSFTPKYYYFGERQAQILHTRLRTKCSSLNHDIFLKNLTDSPLCRCGSIENAEHYLLQCILYRQQRIEMLNTVSQLCHVTLDVLLSGDSSLSIDTNNKYSYQCINLSKTQNDSNTPINLTTLLKVNKIYFLIHKYTYVVISMTGRFSIDYTSSVHVIIGKKPDQQSITKTKWFEIPCPHDLLPHNNPPHFELYSR